MIADAPSALQLDALREVANVGCAHAATALSKLVGGRTVRIDVPRVMTASASSVSDLAGGKAPVFAVVLEIEGDVRGRMVLLWPERDAAELSRLLLGEGEHEREDDREQSAHALTEDPRRSALAEVGNIVGSACLSAVGTLARMRLLPSIPHVQFDSASAVIGPLLADHRSGAEAVVLEARFFTSAAPVLEGRLLLVPDRAGLPALFRALGI